MASERMFTLTETQLREMLSRAYDKGWFKARRGPLAADMRMGAWQDELIREHAAQPAPTPAETLNVEDFAIAMWQGICELSDRNSPEDEPEAATITLRELRTVVASVLEKDPPPATTPGTGWQPIEMRPFAQRCVEEWNQGHLPLVDTIEKHMQQLLAQLERAKLNVEAIPAGIREAHPAYQEMQRRSKEAEVMEDGAALIAAERQRQVEQERWTAGHDAQHTAGEMVGASRAYAKHAQQQIAGVRGPLRRPLEWPWEVNWWKPSDDPIRNLVKAGALIAAEIDRLRRADPQPLPTGASTRPSEDRE